MSDLIQKLSEAQDIIDELRRRWWAGAEEIERLLFERDKYKDEAHLLTKERDKLQAVVDAYEKGHNFSYHNFPENLDYRCELCEALAALKEADDD